VKNPSRYCQASVVIVNWNGRQWLEQCIPALASQSFAEFETIVVDNGSDDASLHWLAEKWPSIRVVSLPNNHGFAHGNNLGIALARSDLIVTLNNDTAVAPDWLAHLIDAAAEPQIGMVACQIKQWRRPELLDSTGIEVDWTGTAWQRGHNAPVAEALAAGDVFGPSGAAALYRRAMLDDVGLFDADFFAYYEDVDLAWRAQNAGWRCRYAPAARLRHYQSATGGRFPEQKLFLLSRNKIWTILKNYPAPDLFYMWPLILAGEATAVFYHALRSGSLMALKGRLAALRQAARMVARRQRPHRRATLQTPLRRR
jgi:GT2 family glycosyltransferase